MKLVFKIKENSNTGLDECNLRDQQVCGQPILYRLQFNKFTYKNSYKNNGRANAKTNTAFYLHCLKFKHKITYDNANILKNERITKNINSLNQCIYTKKSGEIINNKVQILDITAKFQI